MLGHATPDLLAGYAAGSLSEGMGLLVASHLTYCPGCRERAARLEGVGGALLAEAEPVEPSAGCLRRALARLDLPELPEARPEPSVPLPCPLRQRLGAPLCDLRWRPLRPGLSESRLEGFSDEAVSLMQARPGASVPRHAHAGREASLVLAGRMKQGERVFAQGDLAFVGAGEIHGPEVVGDETCLCLVVLENPAGYAGSPADLPR
jgi:putative transcriptional regulator